ncbi:MAG: thioredoxin family protein [Alphaproteobacteria bacterium]
MRLIRQAAIAFAALITIGVGNARTLPAPRVGIGALRELPIVERAPYDEKANANAAVDNALGRALKSGKRVMIDLGGNWCGDCIVLANLMRLPEVKSFIDAHYEVAIVDVGRFDKNLQIPGRWGITKRLEGVPSVLIIDPVSGKLLDQGHIAALADARSMTPQSIADWLALWAK